MPRYANDLEHRIRKMQPVSLPPDQRETVEALLHLLEGLNLESAEASPGFRIVGPGGDSLSIPSTVFELLERLTALLARGEAVSIVPVRQELTTQQAADILNVSRQYLVRLLDLGEIPCRRTGKHRRVRAADVLAFKRRRDVKRRATLDEMTRLSQELGGYAELHDGPDEG